MQHQLDNYIQIKNIEDVISMSASAHQKTNMSNMSPQFLLSNNKKIPMHQISIHDHLNQQTRDYKNASSNKDRSTDPRNLSNRDYAISPPVRQENSSKTKYLASGSVYKSNYDTTNSGTRVKNQIINQQRTRKIVNCT